MQTRLNKRDAVHVAIVLTSSLSILIALWYFLSQAYPKQEGSGVVFNKRIANLCLDGVQMMSLGRPLPPHAVIIDTITSSLHVRVVIYRVDAMVFACFSSTKLVTDWLRNLQGMKVTVPSAWFKQLQVEGPCFVHKGFYNTYMSTDAMIVRRLESISQQFKEVQKIVIVGHSLGGALATLCAMRLGSMIEKVSVYTFGSPRVGDARFARAFNKNIKESIRVVDIYDPIPESAPAIKLTHVKGLYRVAHVQSKAIRPWVAHSTANYRSAINYNNHGGLNSV